MCGLFGFLHYGGDEIKNLSDLTKSLAEQSMIRGTDATGIAFCQPKGICILKEAKSADDFKFRHPDDVVALTGHTRHGTHGSEKKNFNNHPFFGRVSNRSFALAHNGVLSANERQRKRLGLPKTKIETDSYMAVQLIEKKKRLDFESLKYMAEQIDGSFSFTILDNTNNLYFVKGDSPLSIVHFPKLKLYVYASTAEILYRAIIDFPPLFSELKRLDFNEIQIEEGEILRITPFGKIEREIFEYFYYSGRGWWDYGDYGCYCSYDAEDSYVESLKAVASHLGYTEDDIDTLLKEGFSPWEIEEYIYEY